MTKLYFLIIKRVIMRGFATSSNPYERGLRPRRFLEETSTRVKMEIILGKKLKNTPRKAA